MLPRLVRFCRAAVALAIAGACGCSKAPEPVPATKASAATPGDEAVEQAAELATTPPPLSEEDLALIAADPKDLTPELRRKRAYALRRKIMQNPDSPTARMLEDLQKAHADGTLQVPQQGGVRMQLPGTAPEGGPPPAGTRPAEAEPSKSPP